MAYVEQPLRRVQGPVLCPMARRRGNATFRELQTRSLLEDRSLKFSFSQKGGVRASWRHGGLTPTACAGSVREKKYLGRSASMACDDACRSGAKSKGGRVGGISTWWCASDRQMSTEYYCAYSLTWYCSHQSESLGGNTTPDVDTKTDGPGKRCRHRKAVCPSIHE